MINQHIPVWIRSQKSASVLYDIGDTVRYWAFKYSEHAIELFTHLDKIMVDFCSNPEGIEGLDRQSTERWRVLREQFIETTRHRRVPKQFQLSVGRFDDLPGHGVLPSLTSVAPPSSSGYADGKMVIH